MRIVFLILFALLQQPAPAQLPQYHARVFDAQNGLSANTITDIFKDKEDFLWIVYNYSFLVERFDGRTVEKFRFTEPVVHYLNDADNNTWVIGPSSVHKLQPGASRFQSINLGKIRPVRIFQPPGKPVVLLAQAGFYEWSTSQSRFLPVKKPFFTPSLRSGATFFDTCASTIFYPGTQVYAYDYKANSIDSLPFVNLYSIYAFTTKLAILVKYDGSAYWADFANKQLRPLEAARYFPGEKIVHFRISGVVPLSAERFLVLSTTGLLKYDLKNDRFSRLGVYAEGTPFEYEQMLSRLTIDKQGVAWAHAETVIAALSPISKTLGLIRNKELDPGKKWNNAVAAFAEDKKSGLWMATGFGFTRLNYLTGKMEVFHPVDNATDRLSHESIRGILFDGKHVILAPTDKGIWLYDPETKKYRRPVYESAAVKKWSEHDFYDMIYTLKNGDHVFPGRDAFYRLNGQNYRMNIVPLPDSNVNCNVVFQDSRNMIWLGATTSLYCLNEKLEVRFKTTLQDKSAFCMWELGPGKILMGTSKGLVTLLQEKESARIEPRETVIGDIPILGIYKDKNNHFWFSTTDGLYMSDTELNVFRKFDYADNIQSPLFSGNSFFTTKTGLTFLGGRHGVNYFYAENFTLADDPLQVKVQSVYTPDGDTLVTGRFSNSSYTYNKGRLAFNVVTPYFLNAEKIQFRYKLGGIYDNWINNGNNHIIGFSALPAGDYTLRVAASTNGKIWYEAAMPILFTVRPPFWKTGWFILGCVIAALVVLFAVQKRRERILREKERENVQKQKLIAENLQFKLESNQAQLTILENERKAATAKLQSMRLQMNPHFLFNALNGIQQMIMTGNEENATRYLSKFSKLLRMVLTHSDWEVVSLKEEIEMLKLYIELEALRFEDSFIYSISWAEGIDPEDNKVPTLLIQPFVENAIWHGLLHKEGMRELNIHFRTDNNDFLQCVIEDNGIGREAAKQYAKRASQNQHTGKGVSAAVERLKIFNEQNQDHSQLEIQDLLIEQDLAAGTRVVITLPNLG